MLSLRGSPRDHIQGDENEAMRVVALIAQCAQHEFPMSATEWLNQPAKWIAAYEFLHPYLALELKLQWEREKNEK